MPQAAWANTWRIGTVSYLNAVPLSRSLGRRPDVDVKYGVPSAIADQLALGELDAALVPVVEAVRDASYRIVPHVAIACAGPVLSVKLFCRVPVNDVRTVALDPSSRTSSMLARLWLEGISGLSPEYVPDDEPSPDARLLIGDRALHHESSRHDVDLGEAWYSATGLTFVFAVWAVHADRADARLTDILLDAKLDGVKQLDEIAAEEHAARGLSEELCRTYLTRHIRYDLNEDATAGLRWFLSLACEHGLLEMASPRLDDMILPIEGRQRA